MQTTNSSERVPNPNPYAPPDAECLPAGPTSLPATPVDDEALAEALRRLNAHLARPENVEADRRLAGSRIRIATWIMGALVLLVAAAMVLVPPSLREVRFILSPFGIIFLVVGLVTLVSDLRLMRRSQATDPGTALRGFYQSARQGRAGYFISCLCPTAREQQTTPPALHGYPSGTGAFVLSTRQQVVAFLKTWARAGAGQVRWLDVKRVRTEETRGDVAVVSAELKLMAWPQWANVLSIVLFVAIRFLGLIVGLVLLYSLRKRARVTVRKTLLRGSDGLWYAYDGAGAVDQPRGAWK